MNRVRFAILNTTPFTGRCNSDLSSEVELEFMIAILSFTPLIFIFRYWRLANGS